MKRPPHHVSQHHSTGSREANRAFTLVEMLVVIAILAVLAAIAVGAIDRFADSGKQAVTAGRLRQVYVLQMAYAQDNNGQLTRIWSRTNTQTWQEKLFPYLNLVSFAGAKEDPKLVLNSPYQKISAGQADLATRP
jgi:prepilin-type N-terminal cleavage/methylation domain-containing protein